MPCVLSRGGRLCKGEESVMQWLVVGRWWTPRPKRELVQDGDPTRTGLRLPQVPDRHVIAALGPLPETANSGIQKSGMDVFMMKAKCRVTDFILICKTRMQEAKISRQRNSRE